MQIIVYLANDIFNAVGLPVCNCRCIMMHAHAYIQIQTQMEFISHSLFCSKRFEMDVMFTSSCLTLLTLMCFSFSPKLCSIKFLSKQFRSNCANFSFSFSR